MPTSFSAPRQTLCPRRALTRAIAAVAAAEKSLQSGSAVERACSEKSSRSGNRHEHEEPDREIHRVLRANASHLSALSADERAALRRSGRHSSKSSKARLARGPRRREGAGVVDRWVSLLQALSGTERQSSGSTAPTPCFPRDARPRDASGLAGRSGFRPRLKWHAAARRCRGRSRSVRERVKFFADTDVLAFIRRAGGARADPAGDQVACIDWIATGAPARVPSRGSLRSYKL